MIDLCWEYKSQLHASKRSVLQWRLCTTVPIPNPWFKSRLDLRPHPYSTHFFLINLFVYLFIFWLYWVFVSVWGLPPVVAGGGHSSSRCTSLSLSRPLLLRSTGSRHAGSVVVVHGPSCSTACGIFPDQGSNPCPLHWQADSQPLRHQGSPFLVLEVGLYSYKLPS